MALTPTINGFLGLINQASHVSYDPVRGLVVHLNYDSAGTAGAAGFMSECLAAGVAFEATLSDKKSTVTATLTQGSAGFPDVAQDHWQLMANEIQEDIKLHPAFVGLGDTEIDLILAQVDAKIQDRSATADFTGISSLGQQFYWLLTHGQTHFAFGQWVFHWTTYISFNSTYYHIDSGAELIYSTSQVISITNPPDGIASQMTSISGPSVPSGFVFGWRHLPSTRTTQAGNRIEVATEWVLGLYPTAIYASA